MAASEEELEQVDEIVKSYEIENMKKEYNENKELIQLVTKFMQQHKLIVYGGLALNELLPPSYKFYDEFQFPDYDVLSPHAMEHAIKLADLLALHGIKFVEVRQAIHEGTYKVFADFKPIADITQVNVLFYKDLLKTSLTQRHLHKYIKNKKLALAPVNLLKLALYRELASPIRSMWRWRKVYERTVKFCNVHHTKKYGKNMNQYLLSLKTKKHVTPFINIDDDGGLVSFVHSVADMIKNEQLMILGNAAIGLHAGVAPNKIFTQCCRLDQFFSIFEVYCIKVKDVIDRVKKLFKESSTTNSKLKDWNIITEERFYHIEILPRRNRVYLKHKTTGHIISLMTLFDGSNNCFSYVKKSGFIVGTLFSILTILYGYSLLYRVFETDVIVQETLELIGCVENYLMGGTKDMHEKLSVQCYGIEKSTLSVRKERWDKKIGKDIFKYRPEDSMTLKRKLTDANLRQTDEMALKDKDRY